MAQRSSARSTLLGPDGARGARVEPALLVLPDSPLHYRPMRHQRFHARIFTIPGRIRGRDLGPYAPVRLSTKEIDFCYFIKLRVALLSGSEIQRQVEISTLNHWIQACLTQFLKKII